MGRRARSGNFQTLVSPGGIYGHVFFVADVDATGNAAGPGIDICFTGGDFCVVIPLDNGTGSRLIGWAPPGKIADDVRFEDVRDGLTRNTGPEIHKVRWFQHIASIIAWRIASKTNGCFSLVTQHTYTVR